MGLIDCEGDSRSKIPVGQRASVSRPRRFPSTAVSHQASVERTKRYGLAWRLTKAKRRGAAVSLSDETVVGARDGRRHERARDRADWRGVQRGARELPLAEGGVRALAARQLRL